MNIAARMTELRKAKGISQTDLGKAAGVSREMIGRYERAEVVPSVEVAKKIADFFEVSLDYLVGEGQHASFDKKNLKRLHDLEALDKDTRQHLYFVIDNVIQNFKARSAYIG